MRYDPEVHHRRSLRMKGYDYSEPGTYFVTMCVQSGEGVFGRIAGDEVQVNAAGRMVERWWQELTRKYAHVALGEYVVMPNHFHGVVVIMESAPARACAEGAHAGAPRRAGEHGVGAALRGRPLPAPGRPQRPTDGAAPPRARPTLGDMMDWFKTMTTNEYIRGVKDLGWPRFHRKLWQRDYYERIVRTEEELSCIREYILTNPAQWASDRYNPDARRPRGPVTGA